MLILAIWIVASAAALLGWIAGYRLGFYEGQYQENLERREACRLAYNHGKSQGHELGWIEGARFSRPHDVRVN